jgi:ATP-dependent helicase/nuclease subunit B
MHEERNVSTVVVRFGPESLEALRDALLAVRAGDPLSPVDVAVPSSFVGVTVRRRLADPGLVGVRFAPLPRVIADRALPVLANQGVQPLTTAQRRAATKAVLAVSKGELAASASRSGSTTEVVAGVFAELDDADADEETLQTLDDAGRWPAEISALFRSYLELVADAARPRRLVEAALQNPTTTPLIVYLPRRLTPVELRFCKGLAEQGHLHLIVGLTGEERADADTRTILDAVAPSTVQSLPVAGPAHAQTRALPDAEEEARFAVRRILAHLTQQPNPKLDRIGIGYRAMSYGRLVAEQLSAAGLPHHAPKQRSLAQTAAGRALLGLLRLPDAQWSRVAVLSWLRDAPIRDGRDHLPAASWQRDAGEAGVTRGSIEQWQEKLESLAKKTEQTSVGEGVTWPAERAARSRALAAFVTDSVLRVEEIAVAKSWTNSASLLRSTLDHYLGGAQAAAGWGGNPEALEDPEVRARCDVERAAYEETLAIIEGLATLDEMPLPYDRDALLDVLDQELEQQVREATGLGRGVLVGPVWDLAGADLDLLIVVGATESAYPPRGREHPLLRDEIRERIGLRTLTDRRASERRDHLALLASAPEVVLTHPVADTRAQRGAEPAPWLLEQTHPRLSSLTEKQTAPASFQASVCDESLPPASVSEYDTRITVPAAPIDTKHPLAQADPGFARGIQASRDRAGGVFGRWTGGLSHPVPEQVTLSLDRTLSATSLQQYAECPFRYYLHHVLQIRPLDEPDTDKVDAAERGSAAHGVLEQLVRAAIERRKPPTEPWSPQEHDEAQRLLGEEAARMQAEGKAGHPTPWAVRVQQWRRQLRQVLVADDGYRAARQAWPQDVEHHFGDDTALVVELPSGPVRLRGSIDRVDETGDGQLVVLDYKTGKSEKYEAFPKFGADASTADLTDAGKRLQLPLYALAAQRDYGDETTFVSAYYWFVDEGDVRRGGSIDEAALSRFRDVLDTVVGGIRDGAFPARPGEFNSFFRKFDNCKYCDFSRLCGTARDDLWAQLRDDPRVDRYAELAEPSEPQA